MSKAISPVVRSQVIELYESGSLYRSIVSITGVSLRCCQSLVKQWQTSGCKIVPVENYSLCGQRWSGYPQYVYDKAISLKSERERWGAGLIRIKLGMLYPNISLPSERTLSEWFLRAKVVKKKVK